MQQVTERHESTVFFQGLIPLASHRHLIIMKNTVQGAYPSLQVSLGEGAALRHGYVQLEAARGAAHTKSTFVRQAARSGYTLTEACLGAQLARHDVHIEQVRPTSRSRASACAALLSCILRQRLTRMAVRQ
jgi:SUF system FeS cluster assembly, SufBD